MNLINEFRHAQLMCLMWKKKCYFFPFHFLISLLYPSNSGLLVSITILIMVVLQFIPLPLQS